MASKHEMATEVLPAGCCSCKQSTACLLLLGLSMVGRQQAITIAESCALLCASGEVTAGITPPSECSSQDSNGSGGLSMGSENRTTIGAHLAWVC